MRVLVRLVRGAFLASGDCRASKSGRGTEAALCRFDRFVPVSLLPRLGASTVRSCGSWLVVGPLVGCRVGGEGVSEGSEGVLSCPGLPPRLAPFPNLPHTTKELVRGRFGNAGGRPGQDKKRDGRGRGEVSGVQRARRYDAETAGTEGPENSRRKGGWR